MTKNLEKQILETGIARQNYLENLDIRRVDALSRRDSVAYFKLCNELYIDSENIEDIDLYERGQLESKGNLNIPKREFHGRGRVSKQVYQEFIKKSGEMKVRPYNVFADIDPKKKLLISMGYDQLKSKDGYTPIDKCTDSQIGNAYKNTYETACRSTGLKY